jgi:hypothetical protein
MFFIHEHFWALIASSATESFPNDTLCGGAAPEIADFDYTLKIDQNHKISRKSENFSPKCSNKRNLLMRSGYFLVSNPYERNRYHAST